MSQWECEEQIDESLDWFLMFCQSEQLMMINNNKLMKIEIESGVLWQLTLKSTN